MKPTEREEFRAYVLARSPALLRTAYLLTGDHGEAEDLLQDSLVKVAKAWHRIDDPSAVDAYVRRTMANGRVSAWRRRRVETVVVAEPTPDLRDARPDPAGGVAERDRVWAALATLPPRMRAVIVLRYYEDLSEAEIARVLDCAPGNVKSQAARALAKLRDSGALTETLRS